jgi:hypothetical protein
MYTSWPLGVFCCHYKQSIRIRRSCKWFPIQNNSRWSSATMHLYFSRYFYPIHLLFWEIRRKYHLVVHLDPQVQAHSNIRFLILLVPELHHSPIFILQATMFHLSTSTCSEWHVNLDKSQDIYVTLECASNENLTTQGKRLSRGGREGGREGRLPPSSTLTHWHVLK